MTPALVHALTDAGLNSAIAHALGYTYAGTMRGRQWYHPPGVRTTVLLLPDYVQDWNILMPMALRYHLLDTWLSSAAPLSQRTLCEHLLLALHPYMKESV